MPRKTSPLKRALVVSSMALLTVAGCAGSSGTDLGGGDGGSADGGGSDANPGGCPAMVPKGGSACALAEGATCSYGCDQGGPAQATCRGQVWSVGYSAIACQAPDAGDAGPPPASQPFACGKTTCGVTQYCVTPCCGGVVPQCVPANDAGACPSGTAMGICVGPGSGSTGCAPQCTPPPPYCVDSMKQVPSDCSPANVSQPRQLSCACA